MPEEDLRQVLRENVITLLDEECMAGARKASVSALIRRGLSNGTAQRILEAKTNLGLDVLTDLGNIFGVSPWRLLRRADHGGSLQSERTVDETHIELARKISKLPVAQRSAIETLLDAISDKPTAKKLRHQPAK